VGKWGKGKKNGQQASGGKYAHCELGKETPAGKLKGTAAHIRSTEGNRESHYFFRKSTFNEVIPVSRHPLLMLRLLTLRSHTAASQLLCQHHPTSVPYA